MPDRTNRIIPTFARSLLTAGLVLLASCSRNPKTTSDLIKLMQNQARHGRYDDAIHEAMQWEEKYPEDASRNGFLNQQIAFFYLQKARDDVNNRDALVREATAYSDKGLALQLQPDMINLTLAAQVFDSAGDLSPSTRCDFYRRSAMLLEEVIGREQEVKFKTSRVQDQEALARVHGKLSGCEQGPLSH